jgi:metalloendopeptidase OMA1, mitochondrial
MFEDLKERNVKFFAPMAVVLCVILSGCAKDLVTGKKTYNWFAIGEDVKLGEEVMSEQMAALKDKNKKTDADADSAMYEKVKRVTARIGAVSHYPAFPYQAHYADVDIVNAWCAPGGKVMVYSGLFDPKKGLVKKDSEDELAAVLGHEIAHANARHVSEALSRNFTIMAVGQIAVSAISTTGAGALQNAFNRAIVEGVNLYIPYYSRSNEAEADRIGIMYMAKAGYNPKAAVDLWYRACKTKGDTYSLYASHPSDCQRAKDLEALLPSALAEYQKTKK